MLHPPSPPATLFGVGPIYWREAGLCLPAIPLMMLAGLLTGQVASAAIGCGAAFSVGFGAARDLRGLRWGAMWAAALGMAASTFLGSLTGTPVALAIIVAAAAGAGCAALALFNEDLWWITLQAVIFLFVAQYYPGDLAEAARRAALVLAGGVAQIGCVLALRHVAPHAAQRLPAGPPLQHPGRRSVLLHMLRAALCVAAALWSARQLGLANSYWAPMTGMLVLKPGLRDTFTRGFERVGGTVAGCVLATLLVIATRSQPFILVALLGMAAATAFAVQKSSYAVLSCAISGTVVLLITLARGSPLLNAEHRVEATLLGGAIAMACAWIAPRRLPSIRSARDRVGDVLKVR